MRSDTEPIPISDALKLCEMAIEDCDKATEGLWRLGKEPDLVVADADFPVACTYQPHLAVARANAVAIVLSRAVMRQMLEFVKGELVAHEKGFYALAGVTPRMDSYAPISALRDHYDRTRPEWRMSK